MAAALTLPVSWEQKGQEPPQIAACCHLPTPNPVYPELAEAPVRCTSQAGLGWAAPSFLMPHGALRVAVLQTGVGGEGKGMDPEGRGLGLDYLGAASYGGAGGLAACFRAARPHPQGAAPIPGGRNMGQWGHLPSCSHILGRLGYAGVLLSLAAHPLCSGSPAINQEQVPSLTCLGGH